MGRTRDEMMEAAEAEIRRVSDALSKLETDLAHAVEHAEQIEDETFDTQEQAAAISRRMEIAEQEIERLKQEVAEAEDDLRRANADWQYYSGEGDDDHDADGDTGETLALRMPQTSGVRAAWMRTTSSAIPRMNCGAPLIDKDIPTTKQSAGARAHTASTQPAGNGVRATAFAW